MSRTIALSKGKQALVDDDDYEWLSKYCWYWSASNNAGYASTKIKVEGKQKTLLMHIAIAKRHGIWVKGKDVDHKDRNTLNNQSGNLRPATKAETNRNRSKTTSHTSSRFKGVCYSKERGKWRAGIQVGSKSSTIGYFASEEDAARAYDARARLLFGDFACVNLS